MPVIRVALPVPLRQHFDYLLPDNIQVSQGCRVRVPFGKRELVGVVWQLAPDSPYEQTQLKAVSAVLESSPVLSERLASRLCCS
ncbi:primosomal protein N' family DNA-binding protein [Alishewanella longhuensis]